ncbi:MAG: STAS domain-containing protein [Actinomycetota bacterium]|nr:STAS domain-containing protein [Actinomycetota bacterium]
MSLVSVEGVVVARIEGDIDISNAQELGDALLASLTNQSPGMVLDLEPLDYLDSAGVHLILWLAGELRKRRQELSVVAPADAPLRVVLELTATDKVVPVYEEVAAAVRNIQAA